MHKLINYSYYKCKERNLNDEIRIKQINYMEGEIMER